MQTRCPKCDSIVQSSEGKWLIMNAGCTDLVHTRWRDHPEYCPTLSHVVEPEVILPGVTARSAVLAEITRGSSNPQSDAGQTDASFVAGRLVQKAGKN
jgi:hypothetical protein